MGHPLPKALPQLSAHTAILNVAVTGRAEQGRAGCCTLAHPYSIQTHTYVNSFICTAVEGLCGAPRGPGCGCSCTTSTLWRSSTAFPRCFLMQLPQTCHDFQTETMVLLLKGTKTWPMLIFLIMLMELDS